MQSWRITGGFGVDRLALATEDDPEPGPAQALVRVRAISLNYRDLLTIDGSYDPRLVLPHVPCSDACGEVIAVGPGTRRVKIGDRVVPAFAQAWISGRPTLAKLRSTLGAPLRGVLSTHAVLHEDGLVHAPAHLSDAAAATLPCAALTAWHALVDHGALQAGQTVLIQGTGGVSIFGLQIARMFGAQVIATSSKPEKLERLRTMGASATIDYRNDPEWGKTARAIAGGIGVDHVLEVGGAGTLAQSLRAVAPGGIVHAIGVLSGSTERVNVLPLVMNEVRMQGIMVGPRESLEAMMRAFALQALEPVVDRVFSWDAVPGALAHLRSGAHFGKVCIAAS